MLRFGLVLCFGCYTLMSVAADGNESAVNVSDADNVSDVDNISDADNVSDGAEDFNISEDIANVTGYDNVSGDVNVRDDGEIDIVVDKPGEAVLYAHLILMILGWGGALPLGVAIANRTRGVVGASEGAWFKAHRRIMSLGWLLQLVGFGFAVDYVETYGLPEGKHFNNAHAQIGLAVVIAGTLQPLGGILRPPLTDPKTCGRIAAEFVHKTIGRLAVLLGMANVWLGVDAAQRKGYDDTLISVAVGLAAPCMALAILFFGYSAIRPNNAFSRRLTGAQTPKKNNMAKLASHAQASTSSLPAAQASEAEAASEASSVDEVADAEHVQPDLHDYQLQTLGRPTWCHRCQGFLWGFSSQGCECMQCHEIACVNCALASQAHPCMPVARSEAALDGTRS